MNTFATLLLAFPFYLAVNGRLVTYLNLVKATTNTAGTQSSGVQNTTQSVAPIA